MSLKNDFPKALLAIVFCITINSVKAQFGVRAGANFYNLISKDANGKKVKYQLNPGFNLGVTYEIPMSDRTYIQTGLLFTQKGFQNEVKESLFTSATSATAYYSELPINFVYKPDRGRGRFLLGGGPFLGYGISGKFKQTKKTWIMDGLIDTEKINETMQFLNDKINASKKYYYGKPLDYGLNILAGYEYKGKYSAQLNGQLGLANIEPKDGGKKPDAKSKNVGFGISLGYKF